TVQTKLEQIPLLVKDGAIIPMISDSSQNIPPIEARHYGTKENTYTLYNDDGESYDYEKGQYSLTELKVEKRKNGKLIGTSKPTKNNKFNYGEITWRWMTH
ncbi:MAG: DUF5110 domain-containing protein, partial [Maribacter sp.]|nr:DUF5110 domain-containing protein [Maribacter sp.]